MESLPDAENLEVIIDFEQFSAVPHQEASARNPTIFGCEKSAATKAANHFGDKLSDHESNSRFAFIVTWRIEFKFEKLPHPERGREADKKFAVLKNLRFSSRID